MDAARKTAGYFRFDAAEERAALAEALRFPRPLYNAKEKRADGRYRKACEKNRGCHING